MSLLGQHLRQAREARGISPLQVEIDTRIRASIVNALEQGDYENLPPEPFVRGLIRSYANYLGVDSEEMLGLYVADFAPQPVTPAPRPSVVKRPPEPGNKPAPAAPPSTKPMGAATRPIRPNPAVQPADAPPPSLPEEPALPVTPASTAAPTRKPTAIRLPSLRPPVPRPPAPKPSLPLPPAPPESLLPPENLGSDLLAAPEAFGERTSLARATRKPASLPVIAGIIAGVLFLCGLFGLFAAWQISPMVSQLAERTLTPTRLPPTRTATPIPGANPTGVPTLAATAPPFAPAPNLPSPTSKPATPRPADGVAGLHLDVIEVTQPINLRVGVDGVLVFNEQMQPGTTRSWSARDSLYVRLENPKGVNLQFNGNNKVFGARNFQETKLLERQWNVNERGTPVPVTPVAPANAPAPALTPTPLAALAPMEIAPELAPELTPTPALTSNPISLTPTPTLTPFN